MNSNADYNMNVIQNNDEFKSQSIKLALDELQNKGIINDKEKNDLYDLYKKDGRDKKIVFYEIKNLSKEDIQKKLNKNNIIKFPQEVKITMDNVDEFENKSKTKSFIKIHYPYPSDEIKVVENYSGKTKEQIFNEAKDDNGLVSVNGFVSSVDVYENKVEKEKIEVKLHNVTDLAKRGEFNKLSDKEKRCVIGLISSIINQLAKSEEDKKRLSQMPVDEVILKLSKNVFIAPQENIVILCVPNDPTKDEISAVTKNVNGEYELEDLKINDNTKTYAGEAYNKEETLDNNQLGDEEKGTQMRKKAPWEKRKKAS